MVGFGFTDRQETLDWYTTDASARIGTAVLDKEVSPEGSKPHSKVALFGHSLGAIGTLKMALRLPRETAKLIVLCSPALGLSAGFSEEPKDDDSNAMGVFRRLRNGIGCFFRKAVFFPIGGYVLRRVVG
jgi:pimeloyl-ACP methyl ester carboxylesterase